MQIIPLIPEMTSAGEMIFYYLKDPCIASFHAQESPFADSNVLIVIFGDIYDLQN